MERVAKALGQHIGGGKDLAIKAAAADTGLTEDVISAMLTKLIETGKIPRDGSAVLCITGHGLKTQEAIIGKCGEPRLIKPSLREFEEHVYSKDTAAA